MFFFSNVNDLMVAASTLLLSEGTAIETDFTARLSMEYLLENVTAVFSHPQIHGQSDEEYSRKPWFRRKVFRFHQLGAVAQW
jgi:hypothetical protein